jgi:hypothetical protein
VQSEDQISYPESGFPLSPSELEQDRADGAGLSGKAMFEDGRINLVMV